MMASLFQQYIGPAWDDVPPVIQRLHDQPRKHPHWLGWSQVRRGRHWLARVIGRLLRLPPSAHRMPLTLHFLPMHRGQQEQWLRNFGGHTMNTVMTMNNGSLVETFGVASVNLHVASHKRGLVMTCAGARFAGIPLPKWLWPRVDAYEHAYGERCYFSVKVSLPVVGLLVHYHGWLLVEHEDAVYA